MPLPLPLKIILLALVFVPRRTSICQPNHLSTLRLDLLPHSLATTALQWGLISSWISNAWCSSSPPTLARRRSSTANPLPEEMDGEQGESGDPTAWSSAAPSRTHNAENQFAHTHDIEITHMPERFYSAWNRQRMTKPRTPRGARFGWLASRPIRPQPIRGSEEEKTKRKQNPKGVHRIFKIF